MKIYLPLMLTTVLVSALLIQPSPLSSVTRQQNSNTTQSAELAEAEELSNRVRSLYNERKYDKALPLAKKVLTLREKALGPDHALVADALANVAELLYVRGLRRESLRAFRRYLITYDKNRDVDTRDTSGVMISALNRHICLIFSDLDSEDKDLLEAFELQKRLYKLENGFDFDEAGNRPVDRLITGGLLLNRQIRGPGVASPRSQYVFGSLVMKIQVDDKGRVVSAKTICGDSFVAEASEESMLKTTYKPTTVDGKPVPVTALAMYHFSAR